MNCKAKIIADSENKFGKRISIFLVRYPSIVGAEMYKHSKHIITTHNSKAITFNKMIKDVEENPFIPIAWQKKQKSVEGTEYLIGKEADLARNSWLKSKAFAIQEAKNLNNFGVTKQLCNKLLEPFTWNTEIITNTEWEDFFNLCCPKYNSGKNGSTQYFSKKDYCNDTGSKIQEYHDSYWWNINESQADIHIQVIAELMWDAYNESTPERSKAGEWDIPSFVKKIDVNLLNDF